MPIEPNIQSYSDFKKSLETSNCQACALGLTRTHIVVDRGNPQSGAVILGEAPGADEDASGQPFVGRAGRLLDKVFLELGVDTNTQCLVLNIVKCRPPDNRPPAPEESLACRGHLSKQLALIKPKFILMLGATALKNMFPEYKKRNLSELVGQWFSHADYPQSRFLLAYHPAYILRDPRKKQLWTRQLQLFADSLPSTSKS